MGTVKCQQVVCSIYPYEFATCAVDGILYCDRGYIEACAKSCSLREKHRQLLGGLKCSEYEGRQAEVFCEDCCDLFCAEAFIELHNHGRRQQHVQLRVDQNGMLYRVGQLCSAQETARLLYRS